MKNTKKAIKLILVGASGIVTTFSLLSCAASTDPQGFGQKAETEVKKGMTMNQVKSILGSPISSTTLNGETTWHYEKNNMLKALVPFGLGGDEKQMVAVSFNRNGKVSRVNNAGMQANFGRFGY